MKLWKKLFGSKAKAKAPDIEKKESQPQTELSRYEPIHLAAKDGDLEKVMALLIENPDLLDLKNKDGATPLELAASFDRMDVAEFLLSKGAEVVSLAHAKSIAMAELLLANRANVNLISKGGWTALLSAAISGRTERVEFLLAHGAEVNATKDDGDTSLHLAAYYNFPDVVKLLLASGAEVNAINKDGQPPLHSTIGYYDGKMEMVELLLAHGADVNIKDNDGKTPLHLAVAEGKKDVAELLLARRVDVNARDARGKSPLQIALIVDNQELAELLRRHGGREFTPPMITGVELPTELIEAAQSLEQRLRVLEVPTRKVPLAEWNLVPQNIHDLIPNWIPTLLAHYSLLGAVLECENNYSAEWQRYFYFWGPKQFAHKLSGKSRYCFTDELLAEGLVMIAHESNSDMWLTSITGGPSSPIYLFDVSGHEKVFASWRMAYLMSSMAVSEQSFRTSKYSGEPRSMFWKPEEWPSRDEGD